MQRFLLIIFIIFFQQISFAQEQIMFDTSSVAVRKFEPGKIEAYKAEPAFQYERIIEPPKSLWDRFWDWFWKKFMSLLGTEEGGRAFNTMLILVAIGILVFFIMKLTGMTNAGLFGKKNKENALDYSLMDENIHAIDFDTAIQEAIDQKNFRFAVRLLYLQSLKNLADRGLINWQINKTNVAYVHELNASAHQQNFRNLTFQFENNWYGDLPIEENEFMAVREQFNQFKRQLL